MWSNLDNQLSLCEWAELIGFNPLLLSQIGQPREELAPTLSDCAVPLFQDAFKSNNLARNQIAEAICKAEDMIARQLNYWPAPVYFEQPVPSLRLRHDFRGFALPAQLTLPFGRLHRFGKRTKSALHTNEAVVYTDTLSEGFYTRFSVSFTVPAGTLPRDILLVFSAAARGDLDIEEAVIKGAFVQVSGTTATVWGNAALLIEPIHFLPHVPEVLDVTDTSIFAATIDVYLWAYDTSNPAEIVYTETDCVTLPCLPQTHLACVRNRNAAAGTVQIFPATYSSNTFKAVSRCKSWQISETTIYYESGTPRDKYNRVAAPLNRIIAQLATALLPERACGCTEADEILAYYRAVPTNEEGELLITEGMLAGASAAFGVTGRGAVQAYAALATIKTNAIYERMN